MQTNVLPTAQSRDTFTEKNTKCCELVIHVINTLFQHWSSLKEIFFELFLLTIKTSNTLSEFLHGQPLPYCNNVFLLPKEHCPWALLEHLSDIPLRRCRKAATNWGQNGAQQTWLSEPSNLQETTHSRYCIKTLLQCANSFLRQKLLHLIAFTWWICLKGSENIWENVFTLNDHLITISIVHQWKGRDVRDCCLQILPLNG